ncbi:hypothetical protein RBC57_003731 [Salmonella enterica]|uniref:Uncharacterized protein n=1 Tax=Salmonella enterica TaxID=28901 RepID=A0A628V7X2_SALER|nr:hypothetical protein [Salmonella enterica]EEC6701466.1 hypothetical protein [Salmonella enterica]ELF5201525.1 hypothetical protein [Salmonella enterica]
MDNIVKIAPKISSQGMPFYQAFWVVMPANRLLTNTLHLQKLERWLKEVNKSLISHVHLAEQYSNKASLINSAPLSTSRPRSGNACVFWTTPQAAPSTCSHLSYFFLMK